MNTILPFLFGLALALVLPVQAQSLADAVERAWARHPLAVAGAGREAEARARADAAAGLTPGPASVSLSSLNDRLGRNLGRQEWEIELAVPLWLPGQQAARQAEAASIQDDVAAGRRALRWQLAGEVREAWWAVAAARNAGDLARHRLATARELEADVLRRFRVGQLARIDANLAAGERLAAAAELADAESALLQAEHGYRALTGSAAPALLAAEPAAAIGEPEPDHPRLAAATAAARLGRARIELAARSRRAAPELALRLARDRSDFSEPYSNAVGVKLTIPFSSEPRGRQEDAAARAELDRAEAELALARRKLTLDAERARLDRQAAARQLALARERRELAADNLRLAEKSFALGESDLPALLRLRAAALEAEAGASRQHIALAAAQSRLNQILGVLP